MQVIIDSCKRLYEIDGVKEIDRISKLPCMSMKKEVIDKNGNKRMKKCDFPEFMKYTREIAVTKDGKELPQEDIEESKNKLKGRINKDLVCPMNWLQEWLDKIQGASTKVRIHQIINSRRECFSVSCIFCKIWEFIQECFSCRTSHKTVL